MSKKLTAGQVANALVAPHAYALGPVRVARLSDDIAAAIREAVDVAEDAMRVRMYDIHREYLADRGLTVNDDSAIVVTKGHILDDAGNVRKVLGTLPLTADGCVVVPADDGPSIWHPKSIERAIGMHPAHAELTHYYMMDEKWHALDTHYGSVGGMESYGFPVDECYSTREAALAASPPSGGSK